MFVKCFFDTDPATGKRATFYMHPTRGRCMLADFEVFTDDARRKYGQEYTTRGWMLPVDFDRSVVFNVLQERLFLLNIPAKKSHDFVANHANRLCASLESLWHFYSAGNLFFLSRLSRPSLFQLYFLTTTYHVERFKIHSPVSAKLVGMMYDDWRQDRPMSYFKNTGDPQDALTPLADLMTAIAAPGNYVFRTDQIQYL